MRRHDKFNIEYLEDEIKKYPINQSKRRWKQERKDKKISGTTQKIQHPNTASCRDRAEKKKGAQNERNSSRAPPPMEETNENRPTPRTSIYLAVNRCLLRPHRPFL